MFTGICSVFLAVLPMGIAFATGTPLQGSLGWGLSVINGGKSSSSTETEAETDEAETLEVSTGDDKNNGAGHCGSRMVPVRKSMSVICRLLQDERRGGQCQTQTEISSRRPAVPKVAFGDKIRGNCQIKR